MLPARLMQLVHRGQRSPFPPGLAKPAHSCRAVLPPRKRGQEEFGAEVVCRQQNCLALCPNISSAWALCFPGLRQLYGDDLLLWPNGSHEFEIPLIDGAIGCLQ